jgi:hypothetical protein
MTSFYDGIVDSTISGVSGIDLTNTESSIFEIGGSQAWAGYYYGYLDEIRITKFARYTSSFTVESAPFLNNAPYIGPLWPAASTNSVQFNRGNVALGGDSLFVYDELTHNLGIGQTTPTEGLHLLGKNIKIEGTPGAEGIIFPDGSKQVTAVVPKATTSILGQIIVGDNLTVDGNGRVSGPASTPNAVTANGAPGGTAFGFRNRIINGDMRIDQRNNGAPITVTTTPQHVVDRWFIVADSDPAGTVVAQQVNNAVAIGTHNSVIQVTRTSGTWQGLVRIVYIFGTEEARLGGQWFGYSGIYSPECQLTGVGNYVVTGDGINEGINAYLTNSWTNQVTTLSDFTAFHLFSTLAYSEGSAQKFTNNPCGAARDNTYPGKTEVAIEFSYSWAGATAAGSPTDLFQLLDTQIEDGGATPMEHPIYSALIADCWRYYQKRDIWVGSAANPTCYPINMYKVPTITGGGTGFTSTGTTADTLICWQDTPGIQTLVLDADLW